MQPGHFALLTCPSCNHNRMLALADLPLDWLTDPAWAIRDEVLAKMRCERCGCRGRPDVRFGWSNG